jgi:PAS domain S-box-containing protein
MLFMRKRNKSIQQKLMRALLLTSGVALLLVSASYLTYEFFTFRKNVIDQISTEGKIIASNSTASIAFQDEADAYEILSALKAEKNIVAACLFDKQDRVFAQYISDSSKEQIPSSPQNDSVFFRGDFLEAFIPVTQDKTRLGTLFLQSDMTPVYDRFKLYASLILLFGGITFLLAFYISKQLQKNISGPILGLSETARIISNQKDYSIRAKKRSDDEVGILTEAFNQMLAQIESQNKEIAGLNADLEDKIKKRTFELQKSNEELERQKNFVETVLDSSVDITAVYDKQMRLISFNKACEELYKKKKEDVLGKQFQEIFPEPKQSKFYSNLVKALNGEFVHEERYRSFLTGKYFESFFIPLKDQQNNVYAVLTTAHDITDAIESSEQLKNINAALAKSNRDLEQFAYVASHDLQEPLRKIQTFTQLIQKNFANKEIIQTYLWKVKLSAQRMSELISSVLAYSRLSTNDEQFELVDLKKILSNVLTDLELQINEKNAVVESDDLPTVDGVPLQLHQLFSNLINNALKFCPQNPLIKISSRTVSASEMPMLNGNGYTHYMEIKFTDNGIGFDEKYAERIFTIFQRLHSKDQYAGTGIGLALCKKIVENHYGYIIAHGEINKGATFSVYFPNKHVVTNISGIVRNEVASK